jgi:apolipoprotein N-acyltransferase
VALWVSFPPHDLAPLAWVGLWPLLAALRGRGVVTRFALGALTGMIWSQGMVWPWLARAAESHLMSDPTSAGLLAAAAAFLYGAVYPAAFAAVYPALPRPRWLMAPAAWVVLEWARANALGGAPWGLLGHSQHALLAVAQVAELGGVGALSFLCVLPAAALAERGRERRDGLIASALLLLAATGFGVLRLAEGAPGGETAERFRVAALSGAADTGDPVRAYVERGANLASRDLTIWPESTAPGYLQESALATRDVRHAARERGWLLLGARRYEGSGDARRYFNSALLLDPEGEARGSYAKTRLVPFAERSPWPFPSLVERPYSPAPDPYRPLQAGSLRLGVLICWESVFDEPTHAYARQGVDLLVNLTSDRDLHDGAAQHVAFSRFRAIETRRWLLRASGTGETIAIDPFGRTHRGEELLSLAMPTSPPGAAVHIAWLLPIASCVLLLLGVLRGRRAPSANETSHRGTKNRS